jgi:TolB-like protein
LLAAVLVVVAVGAFYHWKNRSGASIDSLAVLPFVNLGGDPNTEYLSDGITESLIDSLSQVPNLKVMSRNSAFRYKGKDTDARTAGREMGVRAVLTGRITQRGENLSVSTELVNVDDNSALWGEQYNRKLADVLAVQQEIAEQISEKLKLRLSNEQKTQLAKHQTDNPEAYQLYLKGHYYASQFTAVGLEKGFDYLRQAIALDPTYAQAYDGLAYAYQIQEGVFLSPLEVMPKAKEAARKAIELDETLAAAHVEMATVHFWFEYDWTSAEREFQRALQLNPNYAPAHEFRGWALISLGRTEEALAESRRAVELDPLFFENISILGWNLYFARRYDQAVTELRKCIDLQPAYWACHFYLAQTYQQQGRFPDAVVELTKARELNDQSAVPPAELAHAYALSGQTAKARQTLNDVIAFAKTKYVDPYALAVVYAALGDKDEAFTRLAQAYAERSFNLINLKVDPELDSLRSDKRFQDLLRRMNFPQ